MEKEEKKMETKEIIVREIKKNKESFLRDLQKLMQVESVKGPAEKHAPFGIGPKNALDTVLTIAENLGFETEMVADAVGYAFYGKKDGEYVGVFGHVDVVAAGDGWHYPPFDLSKANGNLYGRGILDNKGPILSTLYALKIIRDLKLPINKNVRIVFGTDEENGSSDLPLYLAKEEPPIYGFTPDCKYPAVYGERGVIGLVFRTTFSLEDLQIIKQLEGNFDRSSVPDYAKIVLSNGEVIEELGKRSPSNAPELGVNSITKLAKTMSEKKELPSALQKYFYWLTTAFYDKHHGEGLKIAFEDQDSGKLQLTPYDFVLNHDSIDLFVSIRYPISVTKEEILTQLEEEIPENTEIKIIREMDSVVFPKDHPMIQTMTAVYEECTGNDGTPVTTTGATYARFMPNIIAFGPSFPGQKGIAHNHDEYMIEEDLFKNMEIYALTLAELVK